MRPAAWISALLALAPLCAGAEDPPPPEEKNPPADRWRMEVHKPDGLGPLMSQDRAVAAGGVTLRYGPNVLRADRVVHWVKTNEVFLEGGVFLEGPNWVMHAKSGWFNLETEEGVLFGARVVSNILGMKGKAPIVANAAKVRIRTHRKREGRTERIRARVDAEDCEISICTFGRPHIAFKAPWVRLNLKGQRELSEEELAAPESPPPAEGNGGKVGFEEGEVRSGAGTVRAGGVPFLPLPPWLHDLRQPLLKSIKYQRENRFGHSLRSVWGRDLAAKDHPWLDRIGIQRLDPDFLLDYFQERGTGAGIDWKYRGDGILGRLEAYAIHDEKDPLPLGVDSADRWRVHAYHRQQLGSGWQAEAEFYRLSDFDFQRTYYEKEFRAGKPVENRVRLQHSGDYHAYWLLYQARLNDFQQENESLPRTGLEVFSAPIGNTGLLYSSHNELGNLRRENAGPPFGDDRSYRTIRADTLQKLSYPFHTGPVSWEPFAGTRQTWYADDARDNGPIQRGLAVWGSSATTTWRRNFRAESDLLDLDGLRHSIIPRVEYQATGPPTVPASRLLQFDEIDAIAARETVDLSLRQLFQTRRGEERKLSQFADLDWRQTFFPEPFRDNRVTPRERDPESRAFSGFVQSLFVRPRSWINVHSETHYNWYEGVVDIQNTGFGLSTGNLSQTLDRRGRTRFSGDLDRAVRGSPTTWEEAGFGIGVENRYQRETTSRTALRLDLQLSALWGFSFEVEKEWMDGKGFKKFGNRKATAVRRFHDFTVIFSVEYDDIDDEVITSVNFETLRF